MKSIRIFYLKICIFGGGGKIFSIFEQACFRNGYGPSLCAYDLRPVFNRINSVLNNKIEKKKSVFRYIHAMG